MATVTLYTHVMSQPARAVEVFCQYNGIPYELKQVKGLTPGKKLKNEEFKKINPVGKVPAITDGTINVYESHTIMRYLHESRKCADHWYP